MVTPVRHSDKQTQEPQHRKVNAHPAKAFFVDMITRDIELADAILDLLDNCIDGAQRLGLKHGDKPYEGRWAKITWNRNEFIIQDNCGGIPLKIALEYAFRMGRPPDAKDSKPGTIGVYGIGMKRAIFKMGKGCVVHSFTGADTFDVEISKTWLTDDKKWELSADTTSPRIKEHGTLIRITDLHDGIADVFAPSNWFATEFPKRVKAAYSFLIARGFLVILNGVEMVQELPRLLWQKPGDDRGKKDKIRPYFFESKIGGIDVFVAVGFRQADIEDEATEDPEENSYETENAGWTIICNDRVVVDRDRTEQTGWGSAGIPSYHNQFRAISGFVEFRANDPKLLPMTTTKRGVNTSSPVYSKVFQRMSEGVKTFIKFTHEWKGLEREQRKMFSACAKIEVPRLKVLARKHCKLTATRTNDGGKKSMPHLPEQTPEKTHQRIAFTRPIKEIATVSKYLFDSAFEKAAIVGEECFVRFLAEARKLREK